MMLFESNGLNFNLNFVCSREENDVLSENKNKRSPKGHMWSVIPIALQCMLVIVFVGNR